MNAILFLLLLVSQESLPGCCLSYKDHSPFSLVVLSFLQLLSRMLGTQLFVITLSINFSTIIFRKTAGFIGDIILK